MNICKKLAKEVIEHALLHYLKTIVVAHYPELSVIDDVTIDFALKIIWATSKKVISSMMLHSEMLFNRRE